MTTKSQFVGANGVGGMAAVVVAAIAAGLGAGHSALAQSSSAPDSYEVIDLGPWTVGAAHWNGASPAINNNHEIVWTWLDQAGNTHPAIWLDCPRADFPVKVGHPILSSAAGSCLDCILEPEGPGCDGCQYSGGAHDINAHGVAVGYALIGTVGAGPARGWVCQTLGLGSSEVEVLGTLSTEAIGTSVLYCVDDAVAFTAAGNSMTDASCLQRSERAIVRAQPGSVAPLLHPGDLVEPLDPGSSVVLELSSLEGGAGLRAVGPYLSCPTTPCASQFRACEWTWGAGGSGLATLQGGSHGGGACALGGNSLRTTVGCIMDGIPSCGWRAAIWETPASAPVDLAVLDDSQGDEGLVGEGSRANKITTPEFGPTVAVGTSSAEGEAVRWVHLGAGDWRTDRLADLVSPRAPWNLIEATDISDDGWIVGVASSTDPGTTERHAVLLRPIVCRGDLNWDGEVDGADLAVLLSGWGAMSAQGDINHDDEVDGADLAILLGNWGSTCEATGCGDEQSVTQARQTQCRDELECSLAALGFEGVNGFKEWKATATEAQCRCACDTVMSCLVTRLLPE